MFGVFVFLKNQSVSKSAIFVTFCFLFVMLRDGFVDKM